MAVNSKYGQFAVKLIFGLAVLVFVGWKVYTLIVKSDFDGISIVQDAPFYFILVLTLMGINWSLEALKWNLLMRTVKRLRFGEALTSVLSGVATGIVTPNRMGNFIGRSVLVERELRLKAILLTLLANLAQFVVTIFFGCMGLVLLGMSLFDYGGYVLLPVGLLILYFALRVFIHPRLVNRKPFNYFFSEKVEEGIDFISDTELELKLKVIGLSAVRYLVFVIQYVLLLIAFDQGQPWNILFAHIFVVYLLMTLIPSLFFGKLFVREAAALLVLANAGVPDAVILITGVVLWFVNIALPALSGTTLLLRKK